MQVIGWPLIIQSLRLLQTGHEGRWLDRKVLATFRVQKLKILLALLFSLFEVESTANPRSRSCLLSFKKTLFVCALIVTFNLAQSGFGLLAFPIYFL